MSKKSEIVDKIMKSKEVKDSLHTHQLVLCYRPKPAYEETATCFLDMAKINGLTETLSMAAPYGFATKHISDFTYRGFNSLVQGLNAQFNFNNHYRKIPKGELQGLIDKNTTWGGLKSGITRLLRQHGITMEDKLKAYLKSSTNYHNALMTGKGGCCLGVYDFENEYVIASDKRNRYFDSEADMFRYALMNFTERQGIIIGDANIAKFIENNGNPLFNTMKDFDFRISCLREIRALVANERWVLPKAYAALQEKKPRTLILD